MPQNYWMELNVDMLCSPTRRIGTARGRGDVGSIQRQQQHPIRFKLGIPWAIAHPPEPKTEYYSKQNIILMSAGTRAAGQMQLSVTCGGGGWW